MTTMDMIQCGFCNDLAEVFEQYPLEFLADFGGIGRMDGWQRLSAIVRHAPDNSVSSRHPLAAGMSPSIAERKGANGTQQSDSHKS